MTFYACCCDGCILDSLQVDLFRKLFAFQWSVDFIYHTSNLGIQDEGNPYTGGEWLGIR